MRPIETELVACRVPADFKQEVINYAFDNDLSVSQIIRKGLRLLIEKDTNKTTVRSEWLVNKVP
jgi:hypothetical protein